MVRSKAQRSKEMIHDTFRGLSNLGIRCQDSFCWSKKKRNRPHPPQKKGQHYCCYPPRQNYQNDGKENTHNTGCRMVFPLSRAPSDSVPHMGAHWPTPSKAHSPRAEQDGFLLDGIFRQSKKTVGNVSRWHRWHRAEGLTPCLLKAVSSDDKPRDP